MKVITMRIQEFPKKMYAGLFVVLLMFAVSCDGVVDNQQYDVTSKKAESGLSLLSNNGGSPQIGDLLAGQNYKVGTVSVSSDDNQICVTYALDQDALDEGWGIYETHLAIAKYFGDIPVNRGGNPVPGQFPYGDDDLDGEDEWSFCVDFDDLEVVCEDEDEVYIAAHAVVKRLVAGEEIDAAIIYGIGTTTAQGTNKDNDGNIYVIDPLIYDSDIIFNDVWSAAGVSQNFWWYPNALAFDEDNGRLYFSLGQNSLYFFDVETEAVVNADPDNKFNNAEDVLGATFAGGSYWYVLNQSDELIEVKVDGDGIVTVVEDPISMGSPVVLSQGDIVFKDGVIYGSSGTGAGGGSNFKGFFSYDIAGDIFTVLEQDDDYRALQLAWGLDELGNKVLYGHQVEDGTWHTINLDPYGVTQVMDGDEPFVTDRLEDLASGFVYEMIWESETAWAFGERFTERGNWATYFTFTLCEDEELEEKVSK